MQFSLDTRYLQIERHRADWRHCCKCPLHCRRYKVVLWRGYLPCQLLLIGEAPGDVEDSDGFPFVGPAGGILNEALDDAIKHTGNFTYAITNTVACIPRDENGDTREPTVEETTACSPRLLEFIGIASPRHILYLGEVAAKVQLNQPIPFSEALHPSKVLRKINESKSVGVFYYRKLLSSIVNAVEGILANAN